MKKLLVAIEAVGWGERVVGRPEQFRRTAFAKMLRDIADRIQNGGNEGTFERPEMAGEFRLEFATDEGAAAAEESTSTGRRRGGIVSGANEER